MKNNVQLSLHPLHIALILLLQSTSGWALQVLDDEVLSQTTGQDGIQLGIKSKQVNAKNLYWQDEASDSANTRRLQLNNVVISHPTTSDANMKTDVKIQAGANSTGKSGIDVELKNSTGSLSTVESVNICDSQGQSCSQSLGGLALRNSAGFTLHYSTTDGLFNANAPASLSFYVPDLDLFYEQHKTGSVKQTNQLVTRLHFDVQANGLYWIDDKEGFRFNGTVKLGSATTLSQSDLTGNGVYIAFYSRDAAAVNDAQYSLDNAAGNFHIGLNGDLLNTQVYLRGIRDDSNFLGNNVVGSSGIAFRSRMEFANASLNNGTTSFSLDLAKAGAGGNGVRFSNWVALSDPSKNAYLDTGNIYLNLVSSKELSLPVSAYLNAVPSTETDIGNMNRYADLNIAVDANNNYQQNLESSSDVVMLASRGFEFQGIATEGQFIGADFAESSAGGWSLATPIYGFNSNLALWGEEAVSNGLTSERIGFDLAASTTGVSEDGKKTTGVMLVDTTQNQANYIGFRNIDSVMRLQGSLGLDHNQIRLNLPNFMIALSSEFAVGCLPNRPCGSGAVINSDDFTDSRDNLMHVAMKLQSVEGGSATNYFALTSNNDSSQSYIGFSTDLKFANSSFSLAEPTEGSKLALDSLSGRIQFENGRLATRKDANNAGVVVVSGLLTINPNCPVSGSLANCVAGTSSDANLISASATNYALATEDALKVGDFNLYPSTTLQTPNPEPQRLGEAVLTGGKIYSQFTLTPR